MEDLELKQAVETMLFITDNPLPLSKVAQILGEKADRVKEVIESLRAEYEQRGGPQIVEIAEGFQMGTRPSFAPFVKKLFSEKMTMRLSTAALETLSIIAYKQPITRAEIEEIRGVDVIAALESLLDKRLIKVVDRRESVGRPLLYGTTPDFMRHFGLKSLQDMPPLESFQPPQPEAPVAQPADASAPIEGELVAAGVGAESETALEASTAPIPSAGAVVMSEDAQVVSEDQQIQQGAASSEPTMQIWPTADIQEPTAPDSAGELPAPDAPPASDDSTES